MSAARSRTGARRILDRSSGETIPNSVAGAGVREFGRLGFLAGRGLGPGFCRLRILVFFERRQKLIVAERYGCAREHAGV